MVHGTTGFSAGAVFSGLFLRKMRAASARSGSNIAIEGGIRRDNTHLIVSIDYAFE
jgi:hypothetical protein